MTQFKIIGTSHIASQSVKQVKQAFQEHPDFVAIELDKQRLQGLFEEPRTISIRNIFNLGITGFLFAKVGQYIQQKFGAQVGISPGAEMRAAVEEAKEHAVPLILIDQPIQKTLQNISKKTSKWEKAKLFFYILALPFLPIITFFSRKKKQVDLSKVPSKDLIDESMEIFKTKFPGMYQALVGDRNTYMANQLKSIAIKFPDKNILVVVGAGHAEEIVKLLSS